MKLIKKINVVEKDGVKKRYTNFSLIITINDNEVAIPIQPVNFGAASNRKNYSLLDFAASKEGDNNDNSPF